MCIFFAMQKTHALLTQCPKCGALKSARSQTCGQCATKGKKKALQKIVTCECRQCHELFLIPLWRMKQGRGLFCSRPCVNAFLGTVKGEQHHKYTGRHAPARYEGTNWEKARAAVILRAGGLCEWCGKKLATVKRYAVHHLIGLHKFTNPEDGHTPDNLSVICQSCHAKHHGLGKIPTKEVMPYDAKHDLGEMLPGRMAELDNE